MKKQQQKTKEEQFKDCLKTIKLLNNALDELDCAT
jgi:hypothetical protein